MVKDGLNLDTIVARAQGQVSCVLDKEVVALSVEKGSYFQIDEVGSRIWELLENPLAVSELCERLTVEFDVERERCEGDSLSFLRAMRDAGLVEFHEEISGEA